MTIIELETFYYNVHLKVFITKCHQAWGFHANKNKISLTPMVPHQKTYDPVSPDGHAPLFYDYQKVSNSFAQSELPVTDLTS